MIHTSIRQLLIYALQRGLVRREDLVYTLNRLLELFRLDSAECETELLEMTDYGSEEIPQLEQILSSMLDYAYAQGMFESNTVAYRDLFDTRIMGLLTPPPSQISAVFRDLYRKSPQEATDFYYRFSQDTDYIRRYRVSKDMRWTASTEYGELDITINLSKPEKDPKAIAAARNAKNVGYPKCQLCVENEGYAGRLDHPARQNHRIIPISILGEPWGFQYSPYVYYNEHCIVFNKKHTPMKISRETFAKLFDFVRQFPHYFIGSNADLPIVGGSILSHDHFQGGHYTFAMAKAPIEKHWSIAGFEDVEAGIVKWPMSVIRIRHADADRLVELADHILTKWRGYTDETVCIYAETEGVPHNTITPIARRAGSLYELDLVLRNNLTTQEHPLGVYHPHSELHHIKKENIGLIEVMGLAVLPSRLKTEMSVLADAILQGRDLYADAVCSKHADWATEWMGRYPVISEENIWEILRAEIGAVFTKVLEHAGVFKRDAQGQAAFGRFIDSLSAE